MPAFSDPFEASDCVAAIPGEDAIVVRPRDPYRVIREVFQVLLRSGCLTKESRRHLVQAFRVALDPALERRITAAVSERWDGDEARALADAIAEEAWGGIEPADPAFSVEVTAADAHPASDDTGELAVLQ